MSLLLCACVCGVARADGDPASDVLASQSLFLPQDADMSPAQQVQLAGLLAAAQAAGYPIRVALIASRTDLGSVTALWQRPGSYAAFLGQELSLVYRGPLLVVMPNGFGLYGAGAGERGAIARLAVPGRTADLASSAVTAISALARASGHRLPRAPATERHGAGGSSDAIAWAVFALGCVAIAAAWAVSLRTRPWRARTAD